MVPVSPHRIGALHKFCVNKFFVKKPGGTNGTWVSVTKGFVKKASGWVQFWPTNLQYPQAKTVFPKTYVGTTTYGVLNSETFFYSEDTIRTTRGDWTNDPTSIRVQVQYQDAQK